MSNVVNSYADQNKYKHREKKLKRFASNKTQKNLDYRSDYVLEKHGTTRHICIGCLASEVRKNKLGMASGKYCQPCHDKLPTINCECGAEIKKTSIRTKLCQPCFEKKYRGKP